MSSPVTVVRGEVIIEDFRHIGHLCLAFVGHTLGLYEIGGYVANVGGLGHVPVVGFDWRVSDWCVVVSREFDCRRLLGRFVLSLWKR